MFHLQNAQCWGDIIPKFIEESQMLRFINMVGCQRLVLVRDNEERPFTKVREGVFALVIRDLLPATEKRVMFKVRDEQGNEATVELLQLEESQRHTPAILC